MNMQTGGRRAKGTDGSDGKYRMTVENRYKCMADIRASYAHVFRLQMSSFVMGMVFLVLSLLSLFNLRFVDQEYMWISLEILVLLANLVGKSSMRRNSLRSINLYTYAMLAFGVAFLGGAVASYFSPYPLSRATEYHQYAWLGLTILHIVNSLQSFYAAYLSHSLSLLLTELKKNNDNKS